MINNLHSLIAPSLYEPNAGTATTFSDDMQQSLHLNSLYQLWIDGVEHRNGAIGVRFPAGVVVPIVSQGCRPIGEPWVVTRSDQHLIHELAGRPASERLNELIASLSVGDRLAASKKH